jgi:hypothetical protein
VPRLRAVCRDGPRRGRVEILWMNRAFPVEDLASEIIFWLASFRISERSHEPSSLVSLDRQRCGRTIHAALTLPNTRSRLTVSIAGHRFEELIGGHPYLIEVAAVANDRWRARIVRIPEVPTALMPFYGPTPGEAASQLRQWLTRAHEHASSAVRPPLNVGRPKS